MQTIHVILLIVVVFIVVSIILEELSRHERVKKDREVLKWYYVNFWFRDSESDISENATIHSTFVSGFSVSECKQKIRHKFGKNAVITRIVKIKEVQK